MTKILIEKETVELALESLKELVADPECDFGPSYELQQERQTKAIAACRKALAQPEQEPVAWLHTKIEGVAVPHRPADLDKHPDRWEALYKTPSPCPTCEALARTVMLDQTSYDTTPPQRTWVMLTNEEVMALAFNFDVPSLVIRTIEAKLKEKNT